jgi:hypothetical protein
MRDLQIDELEHVYGAGARAGPRQELRQEPRKGGHGGSSSSSSGKGKGRGGSSTVCGKGKAASADPESCLISERPDRIERG